MALTKIGSIGINTGIAFAGVTTIATLNGSDAVLSVGGTVNFVSDVSIGGTVSIAGTLTYEDVTNVDAVGLITARDGIKVGSGITLSVDGDGFFTGVITATSYSGIDLSDVTGATGDFSIADKIVHTGDTDTAIRFSAADTVSIETAGNEQIKFNHTTGTVLSNHIVPNNDGTKDIGLTGTRFRAAYVDNYYGSGANLTGINADVVNDTSPQLGGDLQTNGNDIHFGDSSSTTDDNLYFGADNDLRIFHASDVNYIAGANSSNIYIQGDDVAILNQAGNQTGLWANGGGSLDLFHANSKKFETKSYGGHVTGYLSSSSYVGFHVKGSNNDHGFGTNHGSGITTYDVDYYSPIPMFSSKTIDFGSSYLSFPSYAGGNYVKFTAPVAGLYQLELIASVESHHGGDWSAMGWEINTESASSSGDLMNNYRGILAVNERAGDDTEMGCHFSTTIYMNANDYAVLYQQSAAAIRWRNNIYAVRGHLIH
jgi:hypothetical protein